MFDPTDIVIGFITGIITGFIVQYLRFKYNSRIEKMKRLSPYLESAHPIVEKLIQDLKYGLNIQLDDDRGHVDMIINRIALSLEEYADWFETFKGDGMTPELESLNLYLLNHLIGLFRHTRLFRRHGLEYISQQIEPLTEYCISCESKLRRQLRM